MSTETTQVLPQTPPAANNHAPAGAAASAATAATVETNPVPAVASRKGPPPAALMAIAAVAIVGVGYFAYSHQFEDTDDAQVDGTISNITPRVSGTLKSVNVVDNQMVKAGDLLAQIDPADYEVAVAQAKASVAQAEALLKVEDPSVPSAAASNVANMKSAGSDLASAQAALSAARKEQSQFTAQLAQAEANNRNAQLDLERATRLIASHSIAQAEFDMRTNSAAATAANVEALKDALSASRDRITQQESRVESAKSRLGEVESNAPRTIETRKASVLARQAGLDLAVAQLHQAELNLGYTKILAPAAGIIGKKSVSEGDRVALGQQLMAISQIGDLWVTANYRETQLSRMKPGQPATLHIDAIDETLHGSVESIGGATGSRYSILPPENASGNYVKVVQRIPVRIKIGAGQAGMDRLRPGMSVEPWVHLK